MTDRSKMTDSSRVFHPQTSQYLTFCPFELESTQQSPASPHRKTLANGLKMLLCALILLLMCPCVFAETHFGIGVDTGDQKISWVGHLQRSGYEEDTVSTSAFATDQALEEKADRWNPNYETDIDYGAYIKSIKLYFVVNKAF
jgi:hypothetical protein